MPGLGTIVNVAAIVVAGLAGWLFGSRIPERVQKTLMSANAVAVLFLGISGALAGMLSIHGKALTTRGTMMMTISLALGAVLGEVLNLEDRFDQFGEWLKKKTGNARDPEFVNAFVTSSLTVCIGAMAIVGSIEDGISGNHTILFEKALMDAVIILVMGSSMGKGCMFSAIPVGILQGIVTALAIFLKNLLTDQAMQNLSFVGSILIFCVGVNLLWGKKIRVANLLPALVIAVIFAYLPTFG